MKQQSLNSRNHPHYYEEIDSCEIDLSDNNRGITIMTTDQLNEAKDQDERV